MDQQNNMNVEFIIERCICRPIQCEDTCLQIVNPKPKINIKCKKHEENSEFLKSHPIPEMAGQCTAKSNDGQKEDSCLRLPVSKKSKHLSDNELKNGESPSNCLTCDQLLDIVINIDTIMNDDESDKCDSNCKCSVKRDIIINIGMTANDETNKLKNSEDCLQDMNDTTGNGDRNDS